MFVCMYVCAHECRCLWSLAEGVRLLELELRAVVSHPTWMLGTELRSPA